MPVDLATLEAVLLVAMGGWSIVLTGAFLLDPSTVDRVWAVLIALAGACAIFWRPPTRLGIGEELSVAIVQPVVGFLLAGATFLWLLERHGEQREAAPEELGLADQRTTPKGPQPSAAAEGGGQAR
jgi:hypothetical protein